MDETEQPSGESAAPLSVVELLQWCITALAANAWQMMGLVPDPVTKKIERNLDDARLAIDAIAALVEHLKPRLAEPERRELDTLLANLRINFVEQKARSQD